MSRGPDLERHAVWRRRLREFERGSATVAAFCRRLGVSPATFYQWRHKLRPRPSSEPAPTARPAVAERGGSRDPIPAVSFLPVEITTSARVETRIEAGIETRIEVWLPSGARVLVPSRDQEAIRTVLAAVTSGSREERPC